MDESTLDKIAEFICGNGEQYPEYRSSSRLTAFFGRAGLPRFVHDGSTRQRWVLDCLKQCKDMKKTLTAAAVCGLFYVGGSPCSLPQARPRDRPASAR